MSVLLLTGNALTTETLERINNVVNAAQNPIKYLGIDPGNKNGVCGYDAKYYLQFMWTVLDTDMDNFLAQFENVDTCVIEKFMLYPTKAKAQHYSEMRTSKVIGKVESWSNRNKVELIQQPATIKTTGYAWIGAKPLPKSNPHNHEWDAHVHFMYWAVSKGKIDATTLLKQKPING